MLPPYGTCSKNHFVFPICYPLPASVSEAWTSARYMTPYNRSAINIRTGAALSKNVCKLFRSLCQTEKICYVSYENMYLKNGNGKYIFQDDVSSCIGMYLKAT